MLSRQSVERVIEVDGCRLSLSTSGSGKPIVHLRNGGPVPETAALLAQNARVLVIDMSGAKFADAETFSRALAGAIAKEEVGSFGIVAQRDCAELALWTALARPDAVSGMVLVAPAVFDAAGTAKDAKLGARLSQNKTPVLALFGTRDTVSPPQAGRHYRQKISGCHLVFVYDAAQDMETARPAATVVVMREFLERREQFIVSAQSSRIYP